jgi:hypothetical protein
MTVTEDQPPVRVHMRVDVAAVRGAERALASLVDVLDPLDVALADAAAL